MTLFMATNRIDSLTKNHSLNKKKLDNPTTIRPSACQPKGIGGIGELNDEIALLSRILPFLLRKYLYLLKEVTGTVAVVAVWA